MATGKRRKTPAHLQQLFRRFRAADVTLYRHGREVMLDPTAEPDLRDALSAHYDAVVAEVVPQVTDDQREQVDALLAGLDVVHAEDHETAVAAVRELLAAATDAGIITVDTETAVLPEFRQPVPITLNKDGSVAVRQSKDGAAGYALDPRRSRVRLLQCFAGGDRVFLFDMTKVEWNTVAPLFDGEHPLALFNAVFDLKMILSSGGPEPGARVYDTQIAMRLLFPYRGGRWPVSMERAAQQLLEIQLPKGLGASDWGEDLDDDQLRYAALDAVVTYDLWQAQREDLDESDENVTRIADGCLLAVARMELSGMPVDVAAHRAFIATWEQELAHAQNALADATNGLLTGVPTDTEVRAYLEAVLTPEQLEAWPTTGKTNALAANQTAFKTHGSEIPGLQELAAVKMWVKGLSTYGDGLLAKVDDGWIYARFSVAGARTGRFSSRAPNLQNIPKRSKAFRAFREIFRAPAGYVMLAADYSQIELREMAEQSDDEIMLDTYRRYGAVHRDHVARKQFDIHRITALSLEPNLDRLSPDEQDRERSTAKAANFGLIYGSGPRGFATYARASFGIDMTVEDAADIIDVWRGTYPNIYRWQCEHEQETRRDGYVQTLGGRRWWFDWDAKQSGDPKLDDLDDWQMDDAISGYNRNFALNMPIQGTCAEVLQVALDHLDRALRPYDARITATVHDEVVLVVRNDEETVRAVRRILVTKMTRAWLEFHPEAPWRGVVEVGVGPTWADAH